MYTRILFLLLLLLSFQTLAQVEQYELTAINFTGNNEFSAAMLKEVIYSKETPMWALKVLNSINSSYGSPPLYFDSTFIEIDIQSLTSFYKANGFIKNKVSYSYIIDTLYKTASLQFSINENNPFHYGKTYLHGFDDIPGFLLDRVKEETNSDSSERYEQFRVEENITNTLSFLLNNGYMKAVYDSTDVLIDSVLNKVDVVIYFNPGLRYQISDIDIIKNGEGESHVSNKLIKEVIAISPDEYYNLEKIRNSQSRLMKTGLFNSLKFLGGESDSVSAKIPLRVEGSIGRMNELSPELLLDNNQNSFNLGLGGNFIRKNFFGEARKLTLTGKFGVIDMLKFNYANLFKSTGNRDSTFQGYIELSLKVDQPYIFNRPILGSVETYLSTRTEYKINRNTYGSRLSFDFELPEYTFINQLKSYYTLELFTAQTLKDTIDLNFNSITSLIGAEFASINTNDLFFPTKGNNLAFIVEGGISNSRPKVNGDESAKQRLAEELNLQVGDLTTSGRTVFYRTQVTFSSFLALDYLQTSIFASKTRVGYIQTIYGGENLIPLNKTFVAGGSNSVRGWRARQLVPVDTSYLGQKINDVRGGTFLIEGSLEYRKKLFSTIGAALFCDYGNTWNGYESFRFDHLAVAVGFGFRYYSSIAPFRLDFGFKFYDPANKKMIFNRPPFKSIEIHFGIGEAF